MHRPWLKGSLAWFMYSLGPVVILPIVIFIVSLVGNSHSVSLDAIGGRGDFAFMGVALAVGAYATTRKVESIRPGDRDDPHPLSGFTLLVLLLSSATWGCIAGQASSSGEPKHAFFNAVIGLILLIVAAVVSIAVAIAEAWALTLAPALSVNIPDPQAAI